jgi:hypothetical protein
VTFPLDLEINPPLAIVPSTMTTPGIAGLTAQFSAIGGRPPLSFRKLQGAGSIDAATGIYTTAAFGTAQIEVLDAGGSSAVATVRSQRGWANGPVLALAVDAPSHTLFFGGQFDRSNYFSAPMVAAIQLGNGASDLTVDFQSGFDGPVTAIAADDTALYVGGDFRYYRGQSAPRLAKIDLATGELDTNFNQLLGFDGSEVNYLAVAGNHLYLGTATGYAVTYRGDSVAGALLVISADDGSLISAELPTLGNDCEIEDLVPTSDGAVAVYENTGTQFVVRYIGDTLAWSQPLAAQPSAVSVTPTQVTVATNLGLAVFDAATGAPGPTASVSTFAPKAMAQAGGTLYVASGSASQLLAFDATTLIPINNAFTAHAGFNGAVKSLQAVANGIIALNLADGAPSTRIVTGAGFGVADVTNAAAPLSVNALAVSGQRLFAGGQFALYQGVVTRNLGRFDTQAHAIDAAFAAAAWVGSGTDSASAVRALQTDGTGVYVGGGFTSFGAGSKAAAAKRLVRIDATGALDASFLPAGQGFDNGQVNALAWLNDYNALSVGGTMTSFRGAADFQYFAALATPANLYTPPGTHFSTIRYKFTGPINALTTDGAVTTAGGSFTSFMYCVPSCTTVTSTDLVQLDINYPSFGNVVMSTNGSVAAVAQSTNNYAAVGLMSNELDMLGADRSPVTPAAGLAPAFAGTPTSAAFANLDRYLFVGGVSTAGTVAVFGLARLESTASSSGFYPAFVTSDKFNANLQYGGAVQAITSSNGQLYVAGTLSDSNGNSVGSVLILDAETGVTLE